MLQFFLKKKKKEKKASLIFFIFIFSPVFSFAGTTFLFLPLAGNFFEASNNKTPD
jgi:hypothetical protein